MPNSFGNDKSFMITDFEPYGPATNNEAFPEFKRQQREAGCTCRWFLRNNTDYERQENREWDRCPIHGL